jgi:hypothetical protein
MNDDEPVNPQPAGEGGDNAGPRPHDERWRDLAELEQEIRRRLRSNQRFLERFLDEDFVDDDADDSGGEPGDDDEEL